VQNDATVGKNYRPSSYIKINVTTAKSQIKATVEGAFNLFVQAFCNVYLPALIESTSLPLIDIEQVQNSICLYAHANVL